MSSPLFGMRNNRMILSSLFVSRTSPSGDLWLQNKLHKSTCIWSWTKRCDHFLRNGLTWLSRSHENQYTRKHYSLTFARSEPFRKVWYHFLGNLILICISLKFSFWLYPNILTFKAKSEISKRSYKIEKMKLYPFDMGISKATNIKQFWFSQTSQVWTSQSNSVNRPSVSHALTTQYKLKNLN